MRWKKFRIVAIAVLAGCGGTPKDPDARPEYRAWCNSEQKFLTDWDPDRSGAEEARRGHNRTWPHHIVTIRTK